MPGRLVTIAHARARRRGGRCARRSWAAPQPPPECFLLDRRRPRAIVHRADIMPASLWQAAAQRIDFRPLANDLDVDVAIVGGGITGLLCAHALLDEGLRVAVLEAGRIGESSTGNSTGNLYALVGERHGGIDRDAAAAV